MRLDDTDDTRQDILDWSGPLVSDRIADAYELCLGGDRFLCQPMSRQHARVWRMIISADKRRAADARRDLLALARASRLGAEAIDAIDRLVLDELIDVIAARFQRSPAATRRYSRLLIEAAATLTETRLAAA
jgi:hypothetical protein